MRWVFIRPCNHSPYYDPEIQEPLGLEYLSACRRREADPVLILDGALDGAGDVKVGRRAASFQPDAVGFSVMTAQEIASVNAIYAEFVRASGHRTVAALAGGNFVSTELNLARSLLPSSFLLIPFEGENALDAFVLLRQSKRSGSGQEPASDQERTLVGESVQDLDELPFPDRPFAHIVLGSGWAFNLQGSRGCCGACLHCPSPGMSAQASNPWRGRSPVSIADEIEHLHSCFGAASFNFIDEDFLGPNKLAHRRATEFADELRRRSLRISFGIQVRPDTLSEDIIDTLADVGLTYVFMGIESDDPEDFRRWHRRWAPDPYRHVSRLRARGAEVNAGVMMFHSHSTLAGIRRFATTLQHNRLLDYRSAINRQDAMPGSRLHSQAVKDGLIDPSVPGPQPLPYIHPEIDAFHKDVAFALAPLGPSSMQAICSLPPLLSQRYLDPSLDDRCRRLMTIIAELDGEVARTFFAVLDRHEGRVGDPDLVAQLRRHGLEAAMRSAKELVDHGFAASVDLLREATRVDAGI